MVTALRECVPDEVEEAILQSYLFLGYPSALAAFRVWREVSGSPPPPRRERDAADWHTRGEALCRAVYGTQYEALRRNVGALHPELGDWMLWEGYGKVLGREGLTFPRRELCIVALLAVSWAPEQLHSHLRGAIAVGIDPETVESALSVVDEYMSPRARESAQAKWAEVKERLRSRADRPRDRGDARRGTEPMGPSAES